MKNKSLWLVLVSVVVVSFSMLLWQGAEIFRYAPPIPEQIASADGSVLFTKEGILQGQMVWRSVGGHETGSIWGHGSYVAPDWNADWLHREMANSTSKCDTSPTQPEPILERRPQAACSQGIS